MNQIKVGRWKSGDIATNLLSNADFEDGFTAGLADDWTKSYPTQTYTDETSEVHGGSHAQKVTVADDGAGIGVSPEVSGDAKKNFDRVAFG